MDTGYPTMATKPQRKQQGMEALCAMEEQCNGRTGMQQSTTYWRNKHSIDGKRRIETQEANCQQALEIGRQLKMYFWA